MTHDAVVLQPATLWPTVLERTRSALERGALETIPTDYELVEHGSVRFVVRIVASLTRKAAARQRADVLTVPGGNDFNPFLPYDEALFVADVSDTHVCLLNKYNVVDHHVLIVTRAFEDQEALLTAADFEAMWACMAGYEALAFYNAGEMAGASQRHKHLQMVPLPLAPEGPAVPIAPLLADGPDDGSVGRSAALPFSHAFTRVRWALQPYRQAAEATLERYLALLRAVDLVDDAAELPASARAPYNLLVTRDWLLLVPRAAECLATISVNALGFAGALLVRNAGERRLLLDRGPMAALQHVAPPVAISG